MQVYIQHSTTCNSSNSRSVKLEIIFFLIIIENNNELKYFKVEIKNEFLNGVF